VPPERRTSWPPFRLDDAALDELDVQALGAVTFFPSVQQPLGPDWDGFSSEALDE
jgi:hypothetical protein